jgi:uncharacterized iron-regulated membrane protein
MKLARLASFVHKWLALLVGVQIVFWVVSGFFFTLFPIERIRSEDLVRNASVEAPNLAALGDLGSIHDAHGRPPTKLTIERRGGADVILATYADGPQVLLDGTTMRALSPLDADAAANIARAHLTLSDPPTSVEKVTEASAEYKGALPAWRVQFAKGGLSVYVSADTGAVTARRSDLWRLYDTLWALHIMDWRDHENFNHPLIITTALITLLSVIAGIVLIPFRIRFRTPK